MDRNTKQKENTMTMTNNLTMIAKATYTLPSYWFILNIDSVKNIIFSR